MNKKLILFDLDGVLLDSKENMESSWSATCKEHNLNVSFDSYFSHIGRPFKDILDILNIVKNQSEIERTFNIASTELIYMVSFYDGVKNVLSQLFDNGVKTGVVTSKNTVKTEKILHLLNFPFDIVQTPNNDLEGKPAPDHILYAMSQLNVKASDTLYVGDMGVDQKAAKGAKVDYIHALWGYGECHDENTVKLRQISDLINFC